MSSRITPSRNSWCAAIAPSESGMSTRAGIAVFADGNM